MPENPIKEARDCGDGISFEEYATQPNNTKRGDLEYEMTGGALMEFDRCPHRWISGYFDDGSKATEWGALIDCLLLDNANVHRRFVEVPDTYTATVMECPSCHSQTDSQACRKCKRYRVAVPVKKPWDFGATACKEWRDEHGLARTGRQEIKGELFRSANRAANIMLADSHFADVLKASRKQVMLRGFYDDAETGLRIPVKCLIDLVPPEKFLADLKTCTCAHPRAWAKHVYQFGYHVQAARHLDLWNAAHGDTRQSFHHYIQESFEPFESAKRMLSAEFINIGRQSYVRALKRYAKCLKTGEWPGYDQTDNPNDLVIDGHLVTNPEPWMVAA